MEAGLVAKYKKSRYTVITRCTVGLEDHVEMVTEERESAVELREKVFRKSKISESTQKTIYKGEGDEDQGWRRRLMRKKRIERKQGDLVGPARMRDERPQGGK